MVFEKTIHHQTQQVLAVEIYFPKKTAVPRRPAAFTLIEMMAVMAIFGILLTASISLLNNTGTQARKAAAATFISLVEQARTRAVTGKCYVVLAMIDPADLPNGDERCRIGMFKVKEWTGDASVLEGELSNRWQSLNRGVILIPGDVNGIENPMEQPKITIIYGGLKKLTVRTHLIAFNSCGGLHYPFGSAPIIVRLAEGSYRNGIATPNKRGPNKAISENLLKIGRVSARPYPIDG